MSLPEGWSLRVVAATGSTSADLAAAAEAGAPEGFALLAHAQTAGRGRGGRAWHSPSGNLHVSVILHPDCAPEAAGQLGILVALAVADLLRGLGLAPALKWPNDVLVGEAKIAGVLVETALAHGRIAWAVAGIGLNILAYPEGLPYPATSLAAALRQMPGAPPPTAPALAPKLLAHFAARLAQWRTHGFAPLHAAWRALGPPPGAPLIVRAPAGPLHGHFRDLGPDGALLLDDSAGRAHRITAGDVLAA
jgi:BirA family biotin operon repressor/biotin-[acetyl-CoA-carboxylase] ligase